MVAIIGRADGAILVSYPSLRSFVQSEGDQADDNTLLRGNLEHVSLAVSPVVVCRRWRAANGGGIARWSPEHVLANPVLEERPITENLEMKEW